jgi:hypothetical protein
MSEKGHSKSRGRKSSPGTRHRVDDGPAVLAVDPVPQPQPTSGSAVVALIRDHGPRGMIAAQHEAARLAESLGEEIETRWTLTTAWLRELARTHRARAKYALAWRPRYLAVMSLTRSTVLACRAARVDRKTVELHRDRDPDFDAQVIEAQDHAIELLHDTTMVRAIEGVVEPVLWQGIPVAWIRKHDNRLAIEMLRAHMPHRFKTPGHGGTSVTVNGGSGLMQTNIVVDEATRDELVALRREALAQIKRGEARALGPR